MRTALFNNFPVKFVYSRKIGIMMLIAGFLMTVIFGLLGAEAIASPTIYVQREIGFYLLILFALEEATIWFVLFWKRKSLGGIWTSRLLGKINFATAIPLLISSIVASFTTPASSGMWPSYLIMIVIGVASASYIIMGILLSLEFRKGNTGVYGIRHQMWAGLAVLAVIFIFYLTGEIRNQGLGEIQTMPITEDILSLVLVLYIFTIMVAGFLSVITVFEFVYFAFAQYISAKEKTPLKIKGNLAEAKKIFVQYDVLFWFGNLVNLGLAIMSFASSFSGNLAYISLTVLYTIVILVRVPMFFWRRHLEKNYAGDDYLIFKKKHWMMIYTGINLIIVAAIALVLGNGSSTKFSNIWGTVVVYGVFIPYSIIKLITVIVANHRSHKFGDPYLQTSSLVDGMVCIFVLANTVYMIAYTVMRNYGGDNYIGWVYVANVLSLAMGVYAVVVAGIFIINGIRGVRGKRRRYYECHESWIKRIHMIRFPRPQDDEKESKIVQTLEQMVDSQIHE